MTTFKMNLKIDEELAAYIAGYINEEWNRKWPFAHEAEPASKDMVLDAIDAYKGGAR